MKKLIKAFVYSNILAWFSLFSVIYLWKKPFILTILLICFSVLMLIVFKSKNNFYLYFFTALAGALSEIIAIVFGVWEYGFPNFVGIPYWLPFLWGIAGLFIKVISLEIDSFLKKK